MTTYRVLKLYDELMAASIPIYNFSSNGEGDGLATEVTITFMPEATAEQRALAEQIIAVHDPTDYVAAVRNGAEAQAAAIPDWASWTMAQALTWHDTNVKAPINTMTTLTQAKAALQTLEAENRALLQIIVALRNDTWPQLQDS